MQRMPKRPTRHKEFWHDVHALLNQFPLCYPVWVNTIRRKTTAKNFDFGWCDFIRRPYHHYLIVVPEIETNDLYVNRIMMVDSFLHELAHIRGWRHEHDQLPAKKARWHDSSWGVFYAEMYCWYYDDK